MYCKELCQCRFIKTIFTNSFLAPFAKFVAVKKRRPTVCVTAYIHKHFLTIGLAIATMTQHCHANQAFYSVSDIIDCNRPCMMTILCIAQYWVQWHLFFIPTAPW